NQATATRSSGFASIYTANPNANTDIKLNYLSIPILLRYNVGKMVTLQAGPQFSILMNNDKTLLQNGQEAFKGGDFAMAGGLTLNLKMLRVYGRYNIGLNNINDIDNQDKWKNQQIQLGLGLRL
ncbi:MAG TPA: outer membrane beta-barrel protein, partial [Chitinophagaceae bacterium]